MPDLNPASPTAREVLQALDTTGNRQPWVPTIDEQCADEDWLRNHSSYHRKKPKPMLTDFRITTRDDGFSATFQRNGKVVCVFVSDDLAAHADAPEHLRTLADEIEHLTVPTEPLNATAHRCRLCNGTGQIPTSILGAVGMCHNCGGSGFEGGFGTVARPPATVDQVAVERIEAAAALRPLTYQERKAYACDVCGNVPDEDGRIEHGRGCYTQSENGGGESYVEFDSPSQAEAGAYGDHEHESEGQP